MVEPLVIGLVKPGFSKGRKPRRLGAMRGQQDAAPIVTDNVGEVFLMFVQRHHALGYPFLFTTQHIDHGQLQDALAGFLQGGIEDLVQFRTQQARRHQCGAQP